MPDRAALSEQFAILHRAGCFIMPNAWDIGSARILVSLGFPAIATTSAGFAASLGRHDQNVGLDELIRHVEAVASSVDVPVSVDSERLFADTPVELARNVQLLAAAGASGLSIEDYHPVSGIEPIEVAAERVAAAAEAARASGVTLTARAENHLYGIGDLEDTIARLQAFHRAGADVVYAPGLSELADIARVVVETDAPVNVLARSDGPPVPVLAESGVRRVSTGATLAFTAYGALATAARELRSTGTSEHAMRALSVEDRQSAFGDPNG